MLPVDSGDKRGGGVSVLHVVSGDKRGFCASCG